MEKIIFKRKGQSLVELLLAIALASILLPALLTGLVASREGRVQQIQRSDAVGYIREAEEAVRNVRENGWTTFSIKPTSVATENTNSAVASPFAVTWNSIKNILKLNPIFK